MAVWYDRPSLHTLRSRLILLLPLLALLLLPGCRKDRLFTDDPGARLEFSLDSVLFDTVFTQPQPGPEIPSVTKRFVARNLQDRAVRVDIALAGGTPSPYRINVDGLSGVQFPAVEILGKDSIFVFVEVTLDQNNQSNPLVVEDRILFNTNGNEQEVRLMAWGQDAHYHLPGPPEDQIQGLPTFGYLAGGLENGSQICETVIWTNDKPHVIFGYGVVDSCSTLIMQAGTRVHVHGGGGMWIYRHGRIEANGTLDLPITIQGDRLEPFYAEVPGQWDRIWINEGPAGGDNRFTHVVIKNSLIGIQCETWPLLPDLGTSQNRLTLENVHIRNCSAAGILSRNYRISSTNLVVGDCGQYGVALTGGGEYYFNHSTIANYWSLGTPPRQTPAFIMTNLFQAYTGATYVRQIEESQFVNGIVYGSNTNEFQLDIAEPESQVFTFTIFILRTDQATNNAQFFPDQNSIYRNTEPGFANVQERDLRLLPSAQARNKAIVIAGDFISSFDIEGRSRSCDGPPDLGAYEYCP